MVRGAALLSVLLAIACVPRDARHGTAPAAAGEALVGRTLPEGELRASDGAIVRTDALAQDGPVVLVFYRGHW